MTPAPDAGHSRWLAAPFVWARRRLYYAPRPVQAALLLVLAGGLATAAYSGDAYRQRREAEREVAAGWRAFEDAAERADLEAMTAALDRVLAVRPGDPTAGRRKAALAALCADESDPELAAVLLGHHAQNGRLPEAAREARKVLTKFPKDWRAICVLAHHAIRVERDLDECRGWLDELPAPDDPGARLDVGGLLYAIRLSDVVGRDAAPLRGLIVRRLLPLLRGQSAGEAPPQVKAQLIESYLQPFTRADAPVLELAAYWGDVSRLHDRAVTEAAEAEDIDTLLVLGRLTWPLFDTLVRLRAEQRRGVPADPADSYAVRLKEIDARYDALAGEVMGRAGRAWQAVRAKVPARHEPYYGLADLAIRRRDHAGAIRILRDGLAACGSRNELLELLTHLMCAHGNPREALALLWAEATKADTDPAKWCLAASAALAAGERARALAACANARRCAPTYPWACATEAALWLEDGQPARAVELFLTAGRPAIFADPLRARRFARALVESGRPARELDESADEVVKAAVGKQSVVPVGFLRGVLDARGIDPDRAAWVAARAQKLLSDWPDDPSARRLIADALYRRSELSDPPWAPDPGRAAVRGYQALPAADHADPAVAAPLAALSLRVLKDPAAALRAAAPLRDPANAPRLGPAQLEVLAAVLTANGDPAGAIRALERVCVPPTAGRGVPGGTAGCWVQLARAYHAAGRSADARAALGVVPGIPERSSREQAEYDETRRRLEREGR